MTIPSCKNSVQLSGVILYDRYSGYPYPGTVITLSLGAKYTEIIERRLQFRGLEAVHDQTRV